MNRIIIDVTKGELDFMREALVSKHINMMTYLQTCEEDIKSAEEEIEKVISNSYKRCLRIHREQLLNDLLNDKNTK